MNAKRIKSALLYVHVNEPSYGRVPAFEQACKTFTLTSDEATILRDALLIRADEITSKP